MNTQQVRLANSNHILVRQRGGASFLRNESYAIGEQLRTRNDVDLQVDEGIISVPKGSLATVRENNSQQMLLDLGEGLGKFILDMPSVQKYFERASKTESVIEQSTAKCKCGAVLNPGNKSGKCGSCTSAINANRRGKREDFQLIEANPTIATPGAYVEVTGYDPRIGNNRGPKSPGLGGYQTLVGLKGQVATIFGEINGVKTFKVQLERGGEFVLGETEFKVVTGIGTQESKENQKKLQECDVHALMSLGYGL
jgi:hypothetical protein